MWPGPYGEWGSRKYLLASLDQSLARMGLEYVDIFYSHRFDPENAARGDHGGAGLRRAAGQGPLRRHLLLLGGADARGGGDPGRLGTPLLIHQPSYSMLNRWIEGGLLEALEENGAGCIVFSPLAQGLLTDRYLDGVPDGSRAARGSFRPDMLSDGNLAKVRGLDAIARRGGRRWRRWRSPGCSATRASPRR